MNHVEGEAARMPSRHHNEMHEQRTTVPPAAASRPDANTRIDRALFGSPGPCVIPVILAALALICLPDSKAASLSALSDAWPLPAPISRGPIGDRPGLIGGVAPARTGPAQDPRDTSPNVPLDHDAYRFMQRLQAKGLLRSARISSRPLSSEETLSLLDGIPDGARVLSSADLGVLRRLRTQLRTRYTCSRPDPGRDIDESTSLPSSPDYPRGRLSWQEPAGSFLVVDPVFRSRAVLSPTIRERVFQNSYGFSASGSLRGTLGLDVRFRDTREQGTRRYGTRASVLERRIEYFEPKGKVVDYRQATAMGILRLPWFRLEVGKDFASWGPGFQPNLVLSNNAPSFDQVRLTGTYGRVRLTALSGTLRSLLPDSSRSYSTLLNPRIIDRRKLISAHRAEISLSDRIDLGLHEVVVYGDRGPELTYLNPIMFYWAAQSYLGNKDNLMMGADISVRPGSGTTFYAALLADDMKKFKLFSGSYTNKLGIQTGALCVDPFGLSDTEIRGEYVRLEPWVYTHDIPVNAYRHYDALLGNPLGPNADGIFTSLEHRFGADIDVTCSFSRQRHGRNPVLPDGSILNVGGDPFLGLRTGDDFVSKRFLDGDRETRTWLGVQVSWTFAPDGYYTLGIGHLTTAGVPRERSRFIMDISLRYNYY